MKCGKILMIVNPRAGKMTFHNSFYAVIKSLSLAGYEVSVHFTSCPGDATDTVLLYAKNYDMILACGGDGTLNEVLTGVMRAEKPLRLGYIPCGSTNDFAATLGISQKPQEAVGQILQEQFIQMDLGSFNERFFTYAASFGAFTATSYETSQNLKNALGHLAYVLNGAKQLVNMKRIPMRIEAKEHTEEGVYLYGGVTNTTTIGGVYSLPEEEVELNDGKFEVMMVRYPKTVPEYTSTVLNLAVRNYDDPNILFFHTDHVVFESTEAVPFTLDGEFGGDQTRCEIHCLHKAYTINGTRER